MWLSAVLEPSCSRVARSAGIGQVAPTRLKTKVKDSMQLPYLEEWSPRQRRQKIPLMASRPSLVTPSGRFEMQRSGSFPWQRYQGSNPQRLPISTRRCQSLTAPCISNQRGPAHKTNTFVPNEYREVVNPSGLIVYKGSKRKW